MNSVDYYRYRNTLIRNGEVTFSSSKDTIEFMSIFLMGYYDHFLEVRYNASTDPAEKNDYNIRRGSESMLVKSYVQFFLKENLPDSTNWWYNLVKSFRPEPILTIDTSHNRELYDYVLKRLGRTGDVAVSNVFPNRLVFSIVGDLTVRMNTISRR
ncbi:MAG: hypothetical protein ACI4VN_03545 [Clostridia bacterium]